MYRLNMPGGRPTDYSEELADKICEMMITQSLGITRLCDSNEELPHSATVKRWLLKHEQFRAKYNIAKDMQSDFDADEIKDTADECAYYFDSDGNKRIDSASVAKTRNKIEAMKWLASKRLPKKWGDKDKTIESLTNANTQLTELVAKLSKENEKDV